MHGMEILTAKEYNLPILFVVMNNARLGMVYHGHSMQFHRTHPSFEQQEVNISALVSAMNIPSYRVSKMEDLNEELMDKFKDLNGPALLEIALVDNNIPPVGDRVKYLSELLVNNKGLIENIEWWLNYLSIFSFLLLNFS